MTVQLAWVRIGMMLMKRAIPAITLLLFSSLGALSPAEDTVALPAISLDRGFNLLYDLNFAGAHQMFSTWQQKHPDDPLGPVCDAAGLLFSEFNRLGVLESQFYANDKVFAARKQLDPDPAIRDRFHAAIAQAESLARARLAKNGKDRDALLAMTMSSGLQADYAALIEKRNLSSLHFTKEGNNWAQQLLAVDPNCYDAYVATGFSKYIIGSMSAPVRWLVRLGGVPGDKEAGISELKLTAEQGQYLAPFARILLAIAYVRDKDNAHARTLLVSLREQFPENPLFSRELKRLDASQ
jgi:hypothetical protein